MFARYSRTKPPDPACLNLLIHRNDEANASDAHDGPGRRGPGPLLVLRDVGSCRPVRVRRETGTPAKRTHRGNVATTRSPAAEGLILQRPPNALRARRRCSGASTPRCDKRCRPPPHSTFAIAVAQRRRFIHFNASLWTCCTSGASARQSANAWGTPWHRGATNGTWQGFEGSLPVISLRQGGKTELLKEKEASLLGGHVACLIPTQYWNGRRSVVPPWTTAAPKTRAPGRVTDRTEKGCGWQSSPGRGTG